MKYIEYKGGLGDVVRAIYGNDTYEGLSRLKPYERVTVGLICSNPGAKEILSWHPKRNQVDLFCVEYTDPWGQDQRIAHGLPADTNPYGSRKGPVLLHPSPADHVFLKELLPARPYVVLAATAGTDDRNFPQGIADRVVDAVIKAGYKVVMVGRSYENWNTWGGQKFRNPHSEVRIKGRNGLVDMVDKLSFPGTAKAVEMASGVVCCNSAIMHLAWCMKRPVFVMTSDANFESEYKPPEMTIFWGKKLPTTRCLRFREYTDERLWEWTGNVVRPSASR